MEKTKIKKKRSAMTHLKNIHVCGIVTNIQVFQISFVNDSLTSACIWNSNLAGIVIYVRDVRKKVEGRVST